VPLWHAASDGDLNVSGTTVVAQSDHRVLRILTADQISIEASDGQRVPAVVVNRAEGRLMLALPDGTIVRLTLVSDLSHSGPQGTGFFSEQSWTVNARDPTPAVRSLEERHEKGQDIASADQRRIQG
jgi:hypothetical protein